MEFNKRYNRTEFVDFLQHKFLPEDFVVETTSIDIERQTKYIRAITKLGSSEMLDLVVQVVAEVVTGCQEFLYIAGQERSRISGMLRCFMFCFRFFRFQLFSNSQ